jgi:predicted dinucleotide-binding enzyme
MDIAIIGAGNVGKAIADGSVRAGHSTTISATSPESAEEAAKETGAQAAGSNREAVEGADLVVLAVPQAAVDEVTKELGDALNGKVVVDATNQMNDDMTQLATETSVAERIQGLVPGAGVTKAFNYAFAARQADPVVDGTPLEGFVAGDDAAAKSKVLELMGSLGFRPIDAGPLIAARSLEHLGLLIVGMQVRNKGSWQSGWKLIGPD